MPARTTRHLCGLQLGLHLDHAPWPCGFDDAVGQHGAGATTRGRPCAYRSRLSQSGSTAQPRVEPVHRDRHPEGASSGHAPPVIGAAAHRSALLRGLEPAGARIHTSCWANRPSPGSWVSTVEAVLGESPRPPLLVALGELVPVAGRMTGDVRRHLDGFAELRLDSEAGQVTASGAADVPVGQRFPLVSLSKRGWCS